MRKGIATILATMIAVSFLGCSSGAALSSAGSASTPSTVAESKAQAKTESKTESKVESKASDSGKIGEYSVVIESARLSKDYEGKKAVVVKYKFTNGSDKATSFATALIGKTFQDGVQLEDAMLSDDKQYNAENYMKEIKKGASLEVECPYKLSNDKSKVEVEVSKVISMDDEKLEKTFDITALK
jgi:hypothetical protein